MRLSIINSMEIFSFELDWGLFLLNNKKTKIKIIQLLLNVKVQLKDQLGGISAI